MKRNMWEEASISLDDDERIVFPELYAENRDAFDKIVGVAYLVQDKRNPESHIEWMWEGAFNKHKDEEHILVLKKVLIVRLRPPWHKIDDSWLISREEYYAQRRYLRVLDVYLRVQDNEKPWIIELIDADELRLNPGKWNLLELRYLVALRIPPMIEKEFPIINRNNIHTWMRE